MTRPAALEMSFPTVPVKGLVMMAKKKVSFEDGVHLTS